MLWIEFLTEYQLDLPEHMCAPELSHIKKEWYITLPKHVWKAVLKYICSRVSYIILTETDLCCWKIRSTCFSEPKYTQAALLSKTYTLIMPNQGFDYLFSIISKTPPHHRQPSKYKPIQFFGQKIPHHYGRPPSSNHSCPNFYLYEIVIPMEVIPCATTVSEKNTSSENTISVSATPIDSKIASIQAQPFISWWRKTKKTLILFNTMLSIY